MTSSKLFFHSNLRFLRERKKMSQEDLSQLLDLSRNKLQALESGKTQNPAALDMIKFSEYFKVSVDTLLKINLTKLGEQKLRELLAGNDVYMTGSNLRVLSITVDSKNRENVEYVPIPAKAGYVRGFNDPEYIGKLPKGYIPNLPRSGTFRIFPTTGDSMLPIPENSDIVGQYVQDWSNLKPGTPCIVILKGEQDFVFKLVTIESNGQIRLKSLNNLYQEFTVNAMEVIEIWKYYKHQTSVLPQAETNMDEIKRLIVGIDKKISAGK
jgi:transcriptional regulator with XRE-family HTH domain